MRFLAALGKFFNDLFNALGEGPEEPPQAPKQPLAPSLPSQPIPMSPVYTEAKICLDKHITLNSNVPPDVGCAEAVSFVLRNSGITWIPTAGIAGTAQLWELLKVHGKLNPNPQPGNVVISPTGTSIKGTQHGHTGILLQYGIASNDSNSGLFRENYTQGSWNDLFHTQLGFPIYYYEVGI